MIYGLESRELPETYVPLEAYAVLKCLDEEGDVVVVTRSTAGLKIWDSIGLLTVALDTTRQDATDAFVIDGDEEDEEDE